MSDPQTNIRGISIDEDLTIAFTSSGIMISTNKGFHLTIFYDEKAETLNAHLTEEVPGSQNKRYLGRVNIQIKDIEEQVKWIQQVYRSMLIKLRIEDLNRKGYVLFYDGKRRMDRLLGINVKRHSRVRRRKLRPDIMEIRKMFSDSESFKWLIQDPRILYDSDTKRTAPIFAKVFLRKRKLPDLHIVHLAGAHFSGWYFVKSQEFSKFMETEFSDIFLEVFGGFGRAVNEKMDLENVLNRLFAKYSEAVV